MKEDIKDLLISLRKQFKDSNVFCMGEEGTQKYYVDFRKSGSLLLDLAAGGGFAKTRMIELYGVENSGKSTITYLAIAQAQKDEPDKLNAIIDTENSFNPEWAAKLGVNIDNLVIVQPETFAESVWDLVITLIEKNIFAYVVLDSIAGLVSKRSLEEESIENSNKVGGSSGVNTTALNKIFSSGILRKSNSTLIIVNQLRDTIGSFIPTSHTPGGRAVKFYASQRFEISKGKIDKKGNTKDADVVGQFGLLYR